MIKFTWKISNLECVVSQNGLENIVDIIHWRYVATDTQNNISLDMYGAQKMSDPSSDNFIPYNDLTLDMVSEWLESMIDIQLMQEKLTNQINLQINPTKVNLSLPNKL